MDNVSSGIDLEFDADVLPCSPEPCQYETIFLTAHKAPCRAAAFNNDGWFRGRSWRYLFVMWNMKETESWGKVDSSSGQVILFTVLLVFFNNDG